MIKENECITCTLIKRTLPPFSAMIYADGTGSQTIYRLEIPEFSHNESYLKLGVYDGFINMKWCPSCGRIISKRIPYGKTKS